MLLLGCWVCWMTIVFGNGHTKNKLVNMFDMIGYDENLAGIPTLHDIYMIKDGSKFYYHVFSRANADSLQKETLARLEDLANPCHRSSLARIELHSSFSLVSICSNDLSNITVSNITVDEKLRLQAVKLYQRRKQSTRKNFNNSLCLDEIEFTGKTYQYKHTLDDATMYFNEYINKTVYNNPDEFLLSVLYPITTCSISCKDGEQELYKIPGCKNEICDFETESCSWRFINSAGLKDFTHDVNHHDGAPKTPAITLLSRSNTHDNFRKVVGPSKNNASNHYAYYSSYGNRSNVAMIISPYYQHSAEKCELELTYRVIGAKGAELIVTSQFISHRVISHEQIDDDEDAEWTNPVVRSTIHAEETTSDMKKSDSQSLEGWSTTRVHIGEFMYPTRLRIECHASGNKNIKETDVNVECFVDDLKFINCDEEIWKINKCESTLQRKYLCTRNSEQRCIDYGEVCDMHVDCAGEEDEDEQIHHCQDAVPPGARCDFEDITQETGCKQWEFITNIHGNKTFDWHLIQLRNASKPVLRGNAPTTLVGLPASDHTFEGKKNTDGKKVIGHYLFFSTYGDESERPGYDRHELIYSFARTPLFPPTNSSIANSGSMYYRTCMVRFFFCHTGSSIFQLLLVRHGQEINAERLWASGDGSPQEPCIWEKVSVVLPHIETEYYLKINMAKMGAKGMSFSIDDFSMTPNCFLNLQAWKEKYIPDHAKLTTCNTAGPLPPKKENCADGNMQFQDSFTTKRSFLVQTTREYQIELHGASGGKLPGQKVNNNGGLVILNIGLSFGSNISFIVGQMGETPCTKRPQNETKKFKRIYDLICRNISNKINSSIEELRKDFMHIPGTGGGGATVLLVDGTPMAFAGGGGGVIPFAESLATLDITNQNPEGGKEDRVFAESRNTRQKRYAAHAFISEKDNDAPKNSDAQWMAGNGGSFLPLNIESGNCTECLQMHGRLDRVKNSSHILTKAGTCPSGSGRIWNFSGGYGGGGASCGPGGGGGAGYRGGRSVLKNPGEGGTSTVLKDGVVYTISTGLNEGNGKVVVRACSLNCGANATCRFAPRLPGQTVSEYCMCNNGKRLEKGSPCDSKITTTTTSTTKGFIDIPSDNHIRFALALIIALLFLLLIACCSTIICCFIRRRQQNAFDWPKEMQLLAGVVANGPGDRSSRSSSVYNGNRIAGNPLYEDWYFQSTTMPHISRHFIKVVKTIGHGAFGEVFEGIFQFADEGFCRVAIKALPADSGPDVIEDFQTEAKLLNRFQHENIVKFYGVSFEAQPRFIILELLEGGDLKNYLRENRPKPAERDQPQLLKMLDLIEMALDVARGCEYLEQNKFVHRDIAARNCLLTTKDPKQRVVKIADFGMARDIYRNDYYRKGGRAFLPVKWMPPEAFLDGIFTTKTDIWAYSVLLWEIFSMGYMPYTGRPNQEVMQLVVKGGRLDPPNGIPEEIYKFMIKCWDTEALNRPSFGETVDFLLAQARDPQIREEPLPPICSRSSLKTPSDTPSTTRSSAPPGDGDSSTNQLSTISQATISTMIGSMTESTSSAYDSMPTKGEGVSNVCPPYVQKFPKSPIQMRQLERIASGDSSVSSADDSTLHDTGSVKRSPYRIDKNVDFPTTLKTLQNQAPGSRTPLVGPEGGITHSSPPNARNSMLREERKSLLIDEPPARNSLILNASPPALPPKSVAAAFATSIHANSTKNNKASRSRDKSSTEDEKRSKKHSPKTGSQHPSQLI